MFFVIDILPKWYMSFVWTIEGLEHGPHDVIYRVRIAVRGVSTLKWFY